MPRLLQQEIGVGCILFLQRPNPFKNAHKLKCEAGCNPLAKYCGLDSNGYHHPVAVLNLARSGTDLLITFAEISKCGMTIDGLNEKRATTVDDEAQFSPIDIDDDAPYERHYFFESGGMPQKPCYIMFPHRYTLPASSFSILLGIDRAYSLRLTEESYLRVMQKIGLPAAVFVPTPALARGQGGLYGVDNQGTSSGSQSSREASDSSDSSSGLGVPFAQLSTTSSESSDSAGYYLESSTDPTTTSRSDTKAPDILNEDLEISTLFRPLSLEEESTPVTTTSSGLVEHGDGNGSSSSKPTTSEPNSPRTSSPVSSHPSSEVGSVNHVREAPPAKLDNNYKIALMGSHMRDSRDVQKRESPHTWMQTFVGFFKRLF